jgi:hypothetical protein
MESATAAPPQVFTAVPVAEEHPVKRIENTRSRIRAGSNLFFIDKVSFTNFLHLKVLDQIHLDYRDCT